MCTSFSLTSRANSRSQQARQYPSTLANINQIDIYIYIRQTASKWPSTTQTTTSSSRLAPPTGSSNRICSRRRLVPSSSRQRAGLRRRGKTSYYVVCSLDSSNMNCLQRRAHAKYSDGGRPHLSYLPCQDQKVQYEEMGGG